MNVDFPVIGIVALLTGLIVQFVAKPLLEVWIKPTDSNHDTIIRATALTLGVALTAVDTLIGHPLPVDGNAWLLLIGSGGVSGLASIGGYHSLTGSASPTPLPLEPSELVTAPSLTAADLAAALEPALARIAAQVTPAPARPVVSLSPGAAAAQNANPTRPTVTEPTALPPQPVPAASAATPPAP